MEGCGDGTIPTVNAWTAVVFSGIALRGWLCRPTLRCRRALRCAVAVLVVVGLGVVVGCDRRGGGPRATAGPPRPSLGAASADPQTAAVEAYRGMWRAWVAAGATSDPNHPDLTRYASGDALTKARLALQTARDRGLVSKGEPVLNPRIDSASPPAKPRAVRIRDCIDTTKWLTYKASGELANDGPGGRRDVVADVRLRAGTWKVIGFGIAGVGSC